MVHQKRGIRWIFHGKKGVTHDLFFNLFEFLLFGFVILALLFFIRDVSNQTIFEKNYLARDLATVSNAVYAAPGDVVYTYKETSGKFSFTFNFVKNKIEINDLNLQQSFTKSITGEKYLPNNQENQESNAIIFYPFAENKNIDFNYKSIGSEQGSVQIRFLKSSNSIDVQKADSSKNENK